MRMMILLMCSILGLSAAVAQEMVVVSNFDDPNDPNDGWTAAQIQFSDPVVIHQMLIPFFHDPNGDPNGCIGMYDDSMNDTCFAAPAKFLGDKSAFLGGTLTFDLRQTPECIEEGWCRENQPVVYIHSIADGNEMVLHSYLITPKDNWTSYSVRLSPADGNYFGPDLEPALLIDINGSPVTPTLEDVQAVLAHIQAIYIVGDYIEDYGWPGNETAYLDNVQMRTNYVDWDDFAQLAAQWQRNDCTLYDWCAGQDFNRNGVVDLADMQYVIINWLDEMPY